MYKRLLLLFGLMLIMGISESQAQISVLNKLKNKAKSVVNKVTSPVKTQSRSQSRQDKEIEKRANAYLGPDGNRNAEDQAPTIAIPDNTTALLAPLGYPLDEKEGRDQSKIVLPPLTLKGQEKWHETLVWPNMLTNKRLYDEFLALEQFVEDHPESEFYPYSARMGSIQDELSARVKALDDYVGSYKTSKETDKTADYEWEKNGDRAFVERDISGDAYKRVVRSPIDVFFTTKNKRFLVDDDTKAFFEAHGGWANATQGPFTKWDPNPNKEQVNTSVTGQKAVVNYSNDAGGQVDLDGVSYYLHKRNNSCYAVAHSCNEVAVRGKDIVIPQYIELNGDKYPVLHLVGELFRGTKIKSVTLPEGLTEIQGQVFRYTPITKIVIPSTVVRVGGAAFDGCKQLTQVEFLPRKMEIVDREAFADCSALTTVILPPCVERLGAGVFKNSAVANVTLPQNITALPEYLFEDCKNLKTVKVPTSVKTIESGAFSGSGITSIEIPSVTSIDSWGFNNCKALKSVVLNSALKENFFAEAYQEFEGCPFLTIKPGTKELYIPAGFKFVDFK